MITNCRGNKPSNKLKVKQQTSTYGDTKSYCHNDPPPSLPWWQQAFYGHIPISGLYQGQWTLWKLGSSQTQRMPTDDEVNTFIFGHIRQIFSWQLNKNIVRNSIPSRNQLFSSHCPWSTLVDAICANFYTFSLITKKDLATGGKSLKLGMSHHTDWHSILTV